ncbi:IS4 family transposase [Bacillus sp. IITD106]|nr:IS4 family transposase [Bacillus sp. IITD106]
MILHPLPESTVVENCLRQLNLENYRHPFLDHCAKKLLSGKAILMFVEAFLHQRLSLWEMEENLKSKEALQKLIDLEGIHASTLYRKLEKLPTNLLQEQAVCLFDQIDSYYRGRHNIADIGPLSVVDSSEIILPRKAGEWAYCSQDKNGVKIHLCLAVLNEDINYPKGIIASTSAVSDQEIAIHLVVDKDATYVFDRGYINYFRYWQWLQDDMKFVARIKKGSKTQILEEREVDPNSRIIRDADVMIRDNKNDRSFVLRLVEYRDEENRIYRVVTSRWDLSPEQIADIYRQRWKIELFFKWIKQHIKLIRLFSHKPEAVWNQLWLAMIAYAICEMIKIQTGTNKTVWQLLQFLRQYWFDTWDRFLKALHRKPSRTSKGRRKKGKPGRPRKHPKKLKPVKLIEGLAK